MKVYLMPGMGAKSTIFRGLSLPPDTEPVYMEWLMPEHGETLSHYAERLITVFRIETGSVLLGMSFGGLVVREIAALLSAEKLILISTIKYASEMPPHYRFVKPFRPGLWVPLSPVLKPGRTARVVPVKRVKKRLMLYEKYLAIRDSQYFRWAVEQFLNWQSPPLAVPFIHLHGTADRILPVKYLQEPVFKLEGLSHLMVMTHARRLSEVIEPFLKS